MGKKGMKEIQKVNLGPYQASICSATRFFPKLVIYLYQHEKNQLISSSHSWDAADFGVSRLNKPHPFLSNTLQKLLKQFLNFLNFYQHTKNQLIPLIPSWDTANFSALKAEWSHPFLTTTKPIFFNELLISINLHQYAKNQAFWPIS